MCEKCDEILKKLHEGAEKTIEERVALTAAMGAILKEYGPETTIDLLANTLGFVDYQIGIHTGPEKREDMRSLLVSLLDDYYKTADGLVEEDKGGEPVDEEDPFKNMTGSVH
jgi:hypothetical protein